MLVGKRQGIKRAIQIVAVLRIQLPVEQQVAECLARYANAIGGGLKEGDVIQEVNRLPVHTIDDLRAAVRKTPERPLLLLVNRQGSDFFITVRPSA